MIHQPLGGFRGQASDIEIHAREILLLKQRLNEIMAKHTGQDVATVGKDTDRDNFLSAEQAVNYGLVDRVLEVEPGKRLLALKNVTHNEPFFTGHFPAARGARELEGIPDDPFRAGELVMLLLDMERDLYMAAPAAPRRGVAVGSYHSYALALPPRQTMANPAPR